MLAVESEIRYAFDLYYVCNVLSSRDAFVQVRVTGQALKF
jgi:hypothetical protein